MADEKDIDYHVLRLMELHLPIEKNTAAQLREMLSFVSWFNNPEHADLYAGLAKREIINRLERDQAAGPFYRGNTVEVIEDIAWWNGASAIRPKVGLVGRVISRSVNKSDRFVDRKHPNSDYDYLVPTRFLSTDVGYEWDEETCDADRQYVTYNMPASSIRKIESLKKS